MITETARERMREGGRRGSAAAAARAREATAEGRAWTRAWKARGGADAQRSWIISEGAPTGYGGRTVRVDITA